MTESPTPSKFSKWKRPFIGGTLSAGIAAASLLIVWITQESYWFIFLGWPFFFLTFLGVDNLIFLNLGGILIWFILGFGITYFVSSNKKAIQWWLLPFTLALLPTLALWVYLNFMFN